MPDWLYGVTDRIAQGEVVALRAENGKEAGPGEVHWTREQQRENENGHEHGQFAD